MSIDIIKRILLLTILVLAQVLVLNNIHLLGCATPLLYVYLVLRINRFCPQWANLLWGFVIGLCVDIFSNTPGLAAASMTLMSLLQPYVLNIFVAHDNQDDLKPSFRTLGPVKYISYTSILVFIFILHTRDLQLLQLAAVDIQHRGQHHNNSIARARGGKREKRLTRAGNNNFKK